MPRGHEGCRLAPTGEAAMRRINPVAVVVAIAACALAAMPAWAQHEKAEKEAVKAATSWLALVDAGRNAESWDAASSYFKWTVTKQKWDAMLINWRVPLGPVVSRKISRTRYTTDLEGAPKGEYFQLEFKTAFDTRPKAIENVTLMLQGDGSWRVCGYSIPPEKEKK
jgi:hypothetical protein